MFFHREVAPWGLKSDVKLPVGDFSHVAAVYDGNVSRILINGTVGKEQKEGGQDNNPETPVLVGAMQENGSPIEHFDGAIDEVISTAAPGSALQFPFSESSPSSVYWLGLNWEGIVACHNCYG